MITIKDEQKGTKEITYPCTGEAEDGDIILFSESKRGMVIKSVTGQHPAGYWSTSWNMDRFTLHDADIIIKR